MAGEATIYDVAEVAGVSTATVSRVMKGSRLIGEQSSKKVFRAAKTVCYAPKRVRRPRARPTLTVDLLLPPPPVPPLPLPAHLAILPSDMAAALHPAAVDLLPSPAPVRPAPVRQPRATTNPRARHPARRLPPQ